MNPLCSKLSGTYSSVDISKAYPVVFIVFVDAMLIEDATRSMGVLLPPGRHV